jgi:sugar lactone lactonase YvrE
MSTKRFVTFLFVASFAFAQRFVISTFAGGPPGANAPIAALSAALGPIEAVVPDASGNLYISTGQNCVFKVDLKGVLTRVAGNGYFGYSGDGGPAAQSALNFDTGDTFSYGGGALAIDAQGNLYLADTGNQRIRKISIDGTITTIAGTGDFGDAGDGGLAVNAQVGAVSGIAADINGNIYIADRDSRNRIRKISPDGEIDTVPASTTLNLQDMAGLATDAKGNLYVADYAGNRVVEITADGTILPIAGTGIAGFSGDGTLATSGQLNGPFGLALDPAGNLYIADSWNDRVRKVALDGTITTVAGGGKNFGLFNGIATSAALEVPYWVTVDPSGNLVVADTWQGLVRRVSGPNISTVAGGCCSAGDGGPAITAQFNFSLPSGQAIWGGALAMDNKGDLYIADTANLRIRMITPDGNIQTVAGNGVSNGDNGDGGPAVAAQINYPYSVAADDAGNFYIGDGLLRKVSASGIISTLADANGTPLKAVYGLVVDSTGNVRDPGWYSAADSSGNLYAADIHNYVVWKIAPDGTSTIVAGNGTPGFSGDAGPATSAQLDTPTAIAVDAIGDLFIADCFNYRIRIVTPDGIISTIAGNGAQGYSGDGEDAYKATFGLISGMAVDRTGNLYIADQTYNTIRLVQWRQN